MWESGVTSWSLRFFISPVSPWHQRSLPNSTIELVNQWRKCPQLMTSDLAHTLLALNTQTRQAPIWPFCRREPCSVVCELPHPYPDGAVWVTSPHSPKPMILTECTKLLFLFPPFRPQVLISFPQVCSSLKRSSWLLCQRIVSDWAYTHTHITDQRPGALRQSQWV